MQVDAADGHGDGLPVLDSPATRRGVLSIPPEHVRALRLTAADGIWAEVVERVSGPEPAWKLLTVGPDARMLCVVFAPDPDVWCDRATSALGPRPHPEVSVVDTPGALPRAWRRAAQQLLVAPR